MKRYEEVAKLINEGMRTVNICAKLYMSREAFRSHRSYAAERGLIEPVKDAPARPKIEQAPKVEQAPHLEQPSAFWRQKQEWPAMQFEDSDKASVAGCTYARRLG